MLNFVLLRLLKGRSSGFRCEALAGGWHPFPKQ